MSSPEAKFDKFNDSEYLSLEGLKDLQEELEELKAQRRKEIAERLEYAKGLGDLTENTEYQNAKEEQLINESRIAELEDILSRAVIISKENTAGNIQLGSSVSLKKEGGDEAEEYHLVGSEEADSFDGKISYESPLGKTLLGRKKGRPY